MKRLSGVMLRCKHCKKLFKEGFGKGSLKTHQAAVKAAAKKKSTSKSSKKITLKMGHQEVKVCPECKKLFLASKLKKHISYHKRAGIASGRNIQSEIQFVKKLKKQNPQSLIFKTGKESAVPDIVLYRKSGLSFYEVKPTKQENEANSRLKPNQVSWIKKNCFARGLDAYVVFYKGPTRKLTFTKKPLTRKNIEKYG